MIIFSYVLLFIIYACVIKRSKTFMAKSGLIMFGIYYVFPPIVFLLLVPHFNYQTINGEVYFIEDDMRWENVVKVNVLAIYFLLFYYILVSRLSIKINHLSFISDIKNNRKNIIFSLVFIVIFTTSIHAYLIYSVGGFYNFYFMGDWNERYNSSAFTTIIMNVKNILPCFGVVLCAMYSIVNGKKSFIISFLLLLFILLLFVYGGSNRKFALMAVFIYCSVMIDILNVKKVEKYFYVSLLIMFIVFQALLLLRSSDFNVEGLITAFEKMKDVIIISEPVGTYSILLTLSNKIDAGVISYSYFYDIFKFFLYPFNYFIGYDKPNIARTLGYYYNGVDGFTFFPTIILEGLYNLGIIGSILFSFLYCYICRLLIKSITNEFKLILFTVVAFNVSLVQEIRGYSSTSIAFFIITYVIYCVFFRFFNYQNKVM